MKNPIVFVCEAPTQIEFVSQKLFTGNTRNILDAILRESGVECDPIEFLSLSPVPLKRGQKILTAEIQALTPGLKESLKLLEPRCVVLCGAGVIKAINGDSGPQNSHGKKKFNEELQCVCVNTYHPLVAFYEPDLIRDIQLDLKHLRTYERGVNTFVLPELPWTFVDTPETADQFFKAVVQERSAQGEDFVGVLDIETTGLNHRVNKIFSVGISLSDTSNWVITDKMMKYPKYSEKFKRLLEDRDIRWVGQNLYQFDYKFIKEQYGIDWHGTIDTMLVHYTLDERQIGHGLKYLAQQYFDAPEWDKGIDWDDSDNFTLEYLLEEVYPYQVYDLYYTRKLVDVLREELDKEGGRLVDVHYDVLIPGARALGTIEMNGIYVDQEYLFELGDKIAAETEVTIGKIQEIALEYDMPKFNPNSSVQVKELLLNRLKLKPTAGSGTDKEALASMEHPIASLIQECRLSSKLKSTYVEGIRRKLDSDGRIRADFVIWGTASGRLSSRSPNMQNIPSIMGPMIKRAFKPSREGWEIVNIDYSQLELRVAGWLSGDAYLKRAYDEDKDLHTMVAASMYQIPESEVTKMQRYNAKFVDFGVLYGRQAASLAKEELKCSVEVAQRFIDNFLGDFDKLNEYISNQHKFVVENGYVETAFGRRRRFPIIHSGNREAVKRQAVNSPIQGTASDITLTALTRIVQTISEKGWENRIIPLITVHDAITFEVRSDFIPELVRLAYYEMCMNVPLEYRIKWDIDIERGPNYGDVKGFSWIDHLTAEQKYFRGQPAGV